MRRSAFFHRVARGCVAFTVAGLAMAQDSAPERFERRLPAPTVNAGSPAADVVWNYFFDTLMRSSDMLQFSFPESPDYATNELMQLGLSRTAADALIAHMLHSIAADRRASSADHASTCARRAQIVTKEDYLRETEAKLRAGADRRALAVAQIYHVGGAAIFAKVVKGAKARFRATSGAERDLRERWATQPDSAVTDALKHLCDDGVDRARRSGRLATGSDSGLRL
jgi:hypothetical protein